MMIISKIVFLFFRAKSWQKYNKNKKYLVVCNFFSTFARLL